MDLKKNSLLLLDRLLISINYLAYSYLLNKREGKKKKSFQSVDELINRDLLSLNNSFQFCGQNITDWQAQLKKKN